MRRAILLLLLLSPGGARADGGYRAPVTPLPSGAWFREGYQDLVLEHEPATPPRWAAIVGTFTSDARATRAARSLDRARLPLGYPWVVANHELRIVRRCSESIVVTAGLFATREDAIAWRAEDRARARLELVEIEPAGESACGWTWDTDGVVDRAGRHLEVTHVEPSADAPAYDADAVAALADRSALATLAPVCTVPRGSVHAFAPGPDAWRLGWVFAPVRCGGRVAYVPVERTLRAAVFEPGGARLHQITDVTCDSAHFDVWSYSLDGREVIPEEPPLFGAGSCGS